MRLTNRVRKLEITVRATSCCPACGFPFNRHKLAFEVKVSFSVRGEVADTSNDFCRSCGMVLVLRLTAARTPIPLEEQAKTMAPAEYAAILEGIAELEADMRNGPHYEAGPAES